MEHAGGAALFAYGTLVLPDVLEALLGRALPAQPAQLAGYARYRVRGEVFPALAAEAGADTSGVLYTGVDQREWALLDRFEGELYVRRAVRVETPAGARDAWTYLVAAGREPLLTREPWDPRSFAEGNRARWLELCRAFARGSGPGASGRR